MNPEENLKRNLQFLTEKAVDTAGVSIKAIIDLALQLNIPVEDLFHCDLSAKSLVPDIRMVVMDCDGVLTDGGMILTAKGDEIKQFNARDGMGIKKLHQLGMITGIISSGVEPAIVEKRAKMLDIKHVHVGLEPKLDVLDTWLEGLGLTREQVAYIGDDITDLPIIEVAGFSACPADAISAVRHAVDVVLPLKGGDGCVREWVERYWK